MEKKKKETYKKQKQTKNRNKQKTHKTEILLQKHLKMCFFHYKYFSRACFLPKNNVEESYSQSSEQTKAMHGKC